MLLSKENVTLVNLITIQQCFGAGSMKAVKILNLLRDASILDEPFIKSEISGVIAQKDADKILSFDINKIYKIIDDCIKNNIYVITICDNNYPE